jgi:hypothetical protein
MANLPFLFPLATVVTGTIMNAAGTGPGSVLYGGASGSNTGGSVLTLTANVTGTMAANPGAVVTTTLIVGETYILTSAGTSTLANLTAVGCMSMQPGTLFTAVATAVTGTASFLVAPQTCALNGPGLPWTPAVHVTALLSGTLGQSGSTYALDNVIQIYLPTATQFTQGQNFCTTATASAILSLPVFASGPILSATIHQGPNAPDSGSTSAANFINGSTDGMSFAPLSSGLATAAGTPSNNLFGPAVIYSTANAQGCNCFQLQTGVVTGTAHIYGSIRTTNMNSR